MKQHSDDDVAHTEIISPDSLHALYYLEEGDLPVELIQVRNLCYLQTTSYLTIWFFYLGYWQRDDAFADVDRLHISAYTHVRQFRIDYSFTYWQFCVWIVIAVLLCKHIMVHPCGHSKTPWFTLVSRVDRWFFHFWRTLVMKRCEEVWIEVCHGDQFEDQVCDSNRLLRVLSGPCQQLISYAKQYVFSFSNLVKLAVHSHTLDKEQEGTRNQTEGLPQASGCHPQLWTITAQLYFQRELE